MLLSQQQQQQQQQQSHRDANSRSMHRNSSSNSRTIDPILALNVNVSSSSSTNNRRDSEKGDRHHLHASSDESDDDNDDDDDDSSSLPTRLSTLTSLCFLATTSAQQEGKDDGDDDYADSDSSASDDELQFRCQRLAVRSSRDEDAIITTAAAAAAAAASPFSNQNVATFSQPPLPQPLLTGRLLGTCHSGGECRVWDLGRRRVVAEIGGAKGGRRGPGLALRRMSDDNDNLNSNSNSNSNHHFFYQTRDPAGTITLHDLNHLQGASSTTTTTQLQTHSRTFCAAAPCRGNPHLIAAPGAGGADLDGWACVRDWRVPPRGGPVALFHGVDGVAATAVAVAAAASSWSKSGPDGDNNSNNDHVDALDYASSLRRHGMLMSLAMAENTASNNSAVIACGMESGVVAFHDLAMLREPIAVHQPQQYPQHPQQRQHAVETGNIVLDRRAPVLSVDVSLSKATKTADESLVAIAGLSNNGGDDVEAAPLESDPGRVAVIKARQRQRRQHGNETVTVWEPRVRARLSTTTTTTTTTTTSPNSNNGAGAIAPGKLGAAACRFRPGDGRLFAVGGWDHRVRIYDRAAANKNNNNHNSPALLALLRGHAESIRALDWAPDAHSSGLLATGSGDGWVYVWRCFASE